MKDFILQFSDIQPDALLMQWNVIEKKLNSYIEKKSISITDIVSTKFPIEIQNILKFLKVLTNSEISMQSLSNFIIFKNVSINIQ